jgi:hypothetical protein
MRTVSAILVAVVLIWSGFASALGDSGTEKIQVPAAQAWLSLVDGGNYSGSWKEASTYFRGAVSEQSWVASLEAVRKPLGKLVSRKMIKTQESNSLPGAPDGRYVVISFETVFTQKRSAKETVTFMLDGDKSWRAAGYFIK